MEFNASVKEQNKMTIGNHASSFEGIKPYPTIKFNIKPNDLECRVILKSAYNVTGFY
jgi:hypothetical protein